MVKKIVFKILDMHCVSCAINIDMELEETRGVIKAETNYARGETTVSFNQNQTDEQKLIQAVKNAGYNATPADWRADGRKN